jgi:hypothetical protein
MMAHQFDLNKPSHLIANDVLRQLEILMSGSGLHVTFGTQAHDLIDGLIAQYQDKLMPPTLEQAQSKQERDEIAQEGWLRGRLTALRLPAVEDVFVAAPRMFYVTFALPLTRNQIMTASGINFRIESSPPLRNRYRVVFEPYDVEEA